MISGKCLVNQSCYVPEITIPDDFPYETVPIDRLKQMEDVFVGTTEWIGTKGNPAKREAERRFVRGQAGFSVFTRSPLHDPRIVCVMGVGELANRRLSAAGEP